MKKAFYVSNLFLFGFFFGMTLSHVVNGFLAPAITTCFVSLLFVPGILIGKR